jgi:hypothetical protein
MRGIVSHEKTPPRVETSTAAIAQGRWNLIARVEPSGLFDEERPTGLAAGFEPVASSSADRSRGRWLCLATAIDSRRVVGWSAADHL